MELLSIDLHRHIISSQPMALPIQLKILLDVATGLNYLHTYSPTIIHRDLTAKNVLLDSAGLAKIADFGNSRMIGKEQMTSSIGTLVYLAPEAHGNSYDEKIDIFSYGHLMLFILIGKFPDNLLPASYYEKDPGNGIHVPKVRLEVDRRQHYLNDLEEKVSDGSIVQLVRKCLSNKSEDRPAASQLITFLNTKS
jgi:serine/threonine protein kinase